LADSSASALEPAAGLSLAGFGDAVAVEETGDVGGATAS